MAATTTNSCQPVETTLLKLSSEQHWGIRLLGIDHERLTSFYPGRRFRLTDVHEVVEDLIS